MDHREGYGKDPVLGLHFPEGEEDDDKSTADSEGEDDNGIYPGGHPEDEGERHEAQDRHRENIKEPLDDEGGDTGGVAGKVLVLQDEDSDQVAEPGGDDEVRRLADEDAGGGEREGRPDLEAS